jgi:hypothetical protein
MQVNHVLRLHYYVQCRALVPVNYKGAIALNNSTNITVQNRKLLLANPGYTWYVSAGLGTAHSYSPLPVTPVCHLSFLHGRI